MVEDGEEWSIYKRQRSALHWLWFWLLGNHFFFLGLSIDFGFFDIVVFLFELFHEFVVVFEDLASLIADEIVLFDWIWWELHWFLGFWSRCYYFGFSWMRQLLLPRSTFSYGDFYSAMVTCSTDWLNFWRYVLPSVLLKSLQRLTYNTNMNDNTIEIK